MKRVWMVVLVFVVLLTMAPGPTSEAVHQMTRKFHQSVCE